VNGFISGWETNIESGILSVLLTGFLTVSSLLLAPYFLLSSSRTRAVVFFTSIVVDTPIVHSLWMYKPVAVVYYASTVLWLASYGWDLGYATATAIAVVLGV